MRKSRILAVLACAIAGPVFANHADASTGDHWCRQGDPPILASQRTSCSFAGDLVTSYFRGGAPTFATGWLTSKVTHKRYFVTCKRSGVKTHCFGRPGTGISIRFETY